MLSIGVFSFTVYLIPGLFGAPLKAISGWLPPVPTQDFDISTIVREETTHLLSLSQQDLETPKYAATLHIPHGIKGYFDYDQALAVAKKLNKPVFIDFTGHGCVNCRKVESAVWVDNRVRQLFAEKLVVAALYVDDKTVQLEPEDRLLDKDGDTIFTLGSKNMLIQNDLYKENSQPCYFVVDVDGNVLSGATYYEMNTDKYLKFLNEGIERFNHTK
jgi:thiol:disulfide interchange protein DsbD